MYDEFDKLAPRYRIGLVARLTGISTHQLRAWERRYETVTPSRSQGGDRLYSEGDVARLRMLKKLSDLGHSIGHIARLSENELGELGGGHPLESSERSASVLARRVSEQFLGALANMDSLEAENILIRSSSAFDPRVFVADVLLPSMHEVGDRWARGVFTVAQEHAASAVLRTQLGALMRLYPPLLGARVAVSATLASELHEFGALAAALTTASRGWKVVYLGPNLPAEDIAETVHTAHAELVLISIVVNHARVASELERLVARLPEGVRMVLGGAGVASLPALPAGVEVFASIEDLSSVL